jgi:hypothetical protein
MRRSSGDQRRAVWHPEAHLSLFGKESTWANQRRFASVSSLFGNLCRRRDARRRFVSVFLETIRELIMALFGILCQRRESWRRDARRPCAGVVS